ncbi:MAG: hypothetical protein M1832_005444 [Thelocarpon impressellum]|nr:MAG: hypothetical protein M1832_005444 [Thelocarpon impressellum]
MGKPRMIILIRHAQSEGNKNRDIHQTIPDHRVRLTQEGWRQAEEAGTRLRSLLRPDDTLHFFTSPYRRTRETTEGILKSLTSNEPSPTPFPRNTIKVYEEPRLREQDFGNFQPCSAAMERMWHERADYGHFFYRIANGESAADAYDRISGFNESLWRQFGEDDCASVCVLVTHGLMTRVFLMKWYHFSVEYFEDLRNVNHCEFVVMEKHAATGKYILENKLRTWSELKRQRALLEPRSAEAKENHIPSRKRWGGCPNGCDHGLPAERLVRRTTKDEEKSSELHEAAHNHVHHPTAIRADDMPQASVAVLSTVPKALSHTSATKPRFLSPIPISVLQAGRDFGGSDSGAASSSEEDTETGVNEETRMQRRTRVSRARQAQDAAEWIEKGALANALGDQVDVLGDQVDAPDKAADAVEAEAEEKSVRESVY